MANQAEMGILPATSDCSLSNTSATFQPTSVVDFTPPPTADSNRESRKSFHASLADETPEGQEGESGGEKADAMTRTTSYSSVDSDSSDRYLLQGDGDGGEKKRTKMRKFGSIVLYTVYFAVCLAIGAGILISQIIGSPLYWYSKPAYYSWMARTKQHFGVLATTITQWWAPTTVRITGEPDIRKEMRRTSDGGLETKFPERLVVIANHQIYSDWLYLWWLAYTSKLHGHIFIILKQSLQYVPLFGLGMRFYGFIFLARKWATDRARLTHRLSRLSDSCKRDDPMWLLLFPEGTNLSREGRATSRRYSSKMGIPDLTHVLHPRATGVRFCLERLASKTISTTDIATGQVTAEHIKGVDYLYDCTIHYTLPDDISPAEGPIEYKQDVLTIGSIYTQNRPPKYVNMYWRRFAVDDIPYSDEEKFKDWLTVRWREKDALLEYFETHGTWPEDEVVLGWKGQSEMVSKKVVGLGAEATPPPSPPAVKRVMEMPGQGPPVIETEVKLRYWWHAFDVFTVLATIAVFGKLMVKLWGGLAGWVGLGTVAGVQAVEFALR
ncbi:acyltransferase-domain-containing protein [Ascobolus immersus RN42]|uniref:Acyltransferase-domain-containing protein n=1 Tax=Ascobolus immersus RN42 TaxID=1160509 RepID=A0A3N4I8E9_ASCIM|nr:acyltransferase-domain-containing protein [Ascobolus immersus RN42]